jgi:hypothetical protein
LTLEGMQKPGKDDIASGLIWTACRMPPGVVKAMIEGFTKAEAADFLASRSASAPTDE